MACFAAAVFFGSVHIPPINVFHVLMGESFSEHPAWEFIVLYSRLPMAVTALFCGASLGAAGLMLQTALRNPMAGPSILGIDGGATLGVALTTMALGNITSSIGGFSLVVIAALCGALSVMSLLLLLSRILRSSVMLLIAGVMISYLIGSLISLLSFRATQEGVHAFVMWGMGSFVDVGMDRLPYFVGLCLLGLCLSVLLVKPLNALLLGDHYAQNLGIDVRSVRTRLLLATGLLTSACTAFCGPIAFIGLAVPHISRMLLGSANHRSLLPACMLCGAGIALLCCSISTLPQGGVLPINVLTSLIGAPVVIYVLIKLKFQ